VAVPSLPREAPSEILKLSLETPDTLWRKMKSRKMNFYGFLGG
jgi:hypothetical protein